MRTLRLGEEKTRPAAEGGAEGRGWVPGERGGAAASGSQPLAPGAPAAPSPNFRCCRHRGTHGRSARPPLARVTGPASRAEPDLGSGLFGLDRRTQEEPASSLFCLSPKQAALQRARAAPSRRPALPMHLPGCAPAMADGSFSLAGHLLRSPGGSTSRLHSIEAILGFTKDDGILGSFPAERGARGAKERDRRQGARAACPKVPAGGAEPAPPPASAAAPEYEGEYAPPAAAWPFGCPELEALQEERPLP